MQEDIIKEKSFNFAKRVIKLYKYLTETKRENIISKLILRSGTFIGKNIKEAKYIQNNEDIISKLNSALKEAIETEYWIELLKEEYLSTKAADSLLKDLVEIINLLNESVNIVKESNE